MNRHIVCLMIVAGLAGCSNNPTNPRTGTPNPYAPYGCLEAPNSTPRTIEVGTSYEFQGGQTIFQFKLTTPSRIRVQITELEGYDDLRIQIGDNLHMDFFRHNAGSAANEEGAPLQTAVLDTKDALQGDVNLIVNRILSEVTLSSEDGKRLFCERYKVVVQRIL
jgi:hypothetical protein